MIIVRKIVNRLLYKWLIKKGFSTYMASDYAKHVISDLFVNKENLSFKQRVWALRRGFLTDKVNFYQLTEDNYRDYLSDFDYCRMHPLNKEGYSRWIDDKLTLKYILSKYNEFLPEYYAEIDLGGNITWLMDGPVNSLEGGIEVVIKFLEKKGKLAVKRVAGSLSEGFYEFEFDGKNYFINSIGYNLSEFKHFISGLRGYLITEFVVQHSWLREIWHETVHTLRIQTVKYNHKKAECLFAFIRMGSHKILHAIGSADLGITANVDRDSGEIRNGFLRNDNGTWVTCITHPDTKKSIVGKVPHWDEIVNKCIEIHEYLGKLEYIGFDVIVTDESFKIIEINSHSTIRPVQYEYPILANERLAGYFKRYL